MKTYHIYVFTQDSCPPCHRLKKYVERLTEDEQAELDFVPFKTSSGERTALAEEFQVAFTPTLVVAHTSTFCDVDAVSDEEFCDQDETMVECQVGASEIIKHLQATIDAYTYAHPE